MLLTFAIPTYNRAESLRVTLLGFVAQIERATMTDVEIVGIDQSIVAGGLVALNGRSIYLPNIRKAGDRCLQIETSVREALIQVVRTLQTSPRTGRPVGGARRALDEAIALTVAAFRTMTRGGGQGPSPPS